MLQWSVLIAIATIIVIIMRVFNEVNATCEEKIPFQMHLREGKCDSRLPNFIFILIEEIHNSHFRRIEELFNISNIACFNNYDFIHIELSRDLRRRNQRRDFTRLPLRIR